jgi:hypothetical protein
MSARPELGKAVCTAFCAAGLIAMAGCSSERGAPPSNVAAGGSAPEPPAPWTDDRALPEHCDSVDPGPAPIRRLTRGEYNRTVRDLLGDDTRPADSFVPEETSLGFNNNANALLVTPILAEQYLTAAEDLANRATVSLSALLRCASSSIDEACVQSFIRDFTRFAFRRPITEDEFQRYWSAYQTALTGQDQRGALRVVIGAVLLSPRFLYRAESGEPPLPGSHLARLTQWETSTRLSYLLWGSMPDRELFEAADRNELTTPAQIEAQARRLLAHPRAREIVADFHRQWLELDQVTTLEKDAALFPEFTPGLGRHLADETKAFLEHVTWNEPNGFAALFSASFSFLTPELGSVYGVSVPAGAGPQRVELPPGQRAGLLTQAGLLGLHAHADQSSPVHRGRFVRERLLCQPLPPPPPDLVITAPDLDPTLTTRQRFAAHSLEPACKGCHQLMDPIGLGFETYDAMGKWRATENGLPIDASGELIQSDVAGPFQGAVELAAKLANSRDAQVCLSTQWFRYGYGRAEQDTDACSLATLGARLTQSGGNLVELIVALTQTDAFLYRRVQQP